MFIFCIEDAEYDRDASSCSLRPTIKTRLSMDYITDKCTINNMIDSLNKDNTED